MKVLGEIVRNKYLIALAAGLAVVVAVSFLLPPTARALARWFAYISVCCNLIPLPVTPFIILLGKEYPWVAVALVGGVASTLGNLIDYEVFSTFFKTRLLRKIKESEHSQASINVFNRVAFPALVGANFIVFSWDLIRLVAIAAVYPRWKYALATFLGRTARYAILAYLGEIFSPPLWAIGVIAVVVALPALVSWVRSRRRKRKDAAGQAPPGAAA